MEKKKKLTYLLGIVVIGVWGTILYRVYSTYFSEPEKKQTTTTTINPIPTIAQADTFSIVANYRDPFLGKVKPVHRKRSNTSGHASKGNNRKQTAAKTKETTQPTKWPDIKYTGMIKNQQSGKSVALFSINSQPCRMETGETSKEILLKEIHRDSVVVQYADLVKTIYK